MVSHSQSKSQTILKTESKAASLQKLSPSPTPESPIPEVQSDRVHYIKTCAETLEASFKQRQELLRRLKTSSDAPTLADIKFLELLYEEDEKLQRELSDALEVGRLNLESRRQEELKRVENNRSNLDQGRGKVDVESDDGTVAGPSSKTRSFRPQTRLDINKNRTHAFAAQVSGFVADSSDLEKEILKLKKRLDNLGKSPTKLQARESKSKGPKKCQIL